jgi:hypothetical protein
VSITALNLSALNWAITYLTHQQKHGIMVCDRYPVVRIPGLNKMRVPDNVVKCVGFLGDVIGDEFSAEATVFFVTVESGVSHGAKYWYAVAAKHTISEKRIPPWVATNSQGSNRAMFVPFTSSPEEPHWYFHPTDATADVAVTPVRPSADMDILTIPCQMLQTPSKIQSFGIGIGDEVFYPGLFTQVPGKKENTPILRHGNLAMFPKDQVQVDLGKSGKSVFMDVYLVESRSIGGLSGSPVFVRQTASVNGRTFNKKRVELFGASDFSLLGMMCGHYDTIPSRDQINSGIAFVVPSHKILETLDQPALLNSRVQYEQHLLNRVLPKLDEA